jgi:hypothetical protein
MSFLSKRELLAQVAPRYAEAGRLRKSAILDEFTAATGYSRKYAVRLLAKTPAAPKPIRRPREPHYGPAVQDALRMAWAATNYICAKRLVPFLPDIVESLERFGHLDLDEGVRAQLLSMSSSTADRILRRARSGWSVRGVSTTRRGLLLKNRVPVRTFAQWDDLRPGFTEADLVAHCGGSARGSFLRTLVVTDIATGWTECLALPNGSEAAVLGALGSLRGLLPFDLLGLDTDNGTEFINEGMLAYCARERITFTRGRPYRKNDQCFVEQKNGSIVRQLIGYDRYEGDAAYRQLTELYRAVRLFVNFFQPSMKLVAKRRDGSRESRTYDKAQTPFQRLAFSGALTPERAGKLAATHRAVDPVLLIRQLRCLQDALWQRAAPSPAEVAVLSGDRTVSPVRFRVTSCMLSAGAPGDGAGVAETPDAAESAAAPDRKRCYRRTSRSLGPRTYRTRLDPFEAVAQSLREWFMDAPDSTAKHLMERLRLEQPEESQGGSLRTLQRRLHAWRAEAMLSSDCTRLTAEYVEAIQPTTIQSAAPVAPGEPESATTTAASQEASTDAPTS